jgi:hypothetical protein
MVIPPESIHFNGEPLAKLLNQIPHIVAIDVGVSNYIRCRRHIERQPRNLFVDESPHTVFEIVHA